MRVEGRALAFFGLCTGGRRKNAEIGVDGVAGEVGFAEEEGGAVRGWVGHWGLGGWEE